MLMFINIVIGLAVISVVLVLIYGVITMAKGGEGAHAKSNVLMRWRVGIQAFAILAILVGFYVKNKMRGG
ncbi:MAG: twin transmembrane helix small protein [Robiginitomaculum sp.]|nr:twin transmembrane helix small protein [Robiginitomaculum sp.]MDQ7078888.1 twin transmembrane helix small protein [Robiginitomaculum sp.]